MATSTAPATRLQPLAPAPRTGALRAPWLAARLVAVLSLGTGWIHFAYMSSHWQSWWAYGMFFLGVGVAQSLFTIAILRWPRPELIALGIVGNLAIVTTFVFSRTTGLPVGPHADAAERTGFADVLCTGMEVVVVGALLVMAPPRMRRWLVNLALVVGAGLWALRLTGHLV